MPSAASSFFQRLSRGELRYELIDLEPSPGMNYYPLRTIDLDGSQAVSAVVPVWIGIEDVLVHPDPSDGTLWVADGSGEVHVFDAMGHEVSFQMTATSGSARQLFIPSPGAYVVRLGHGAAARHERLLIH